MSSEVTARDVIIADNDYIIRGILRNMLEAQSFSVLQAIDGLEAIEFATRTDARLVILDYKMPKLDGFAACAQIRRRTPRIGRVTQPDLNLFRFVGADGMRGVKRRVEQRAEILRQGDHPGVS